MSRSAVIYIGRTDECRFIETILRGTRCDVTQKITGYELLSGSHRDDTEMAVSGDALYGTDLEWLAAFAVGAICARIQIKTFPGSECGVA